MCGIAGIFFADMPEETSRDALDAMLSTLAHRGPDGGGSHTEAQWSLGHRRLAIIAPTEGQQPMWSRDRRYCISYNGEIYNYIELRQELQAQGSAFYTQSDTEVLLNLLIHEGHTGLVRCNGMFAFAFYDTVERTLLLGRDHFGIKPLYYSSLKNGGMAFASEIKALFHCPGIDIAADMDGICEYMFLQFRFGEATLFKNIYKVQPGHVIRLAAGDQPRTLRWHASETCLDPYHNEQYFVDSLEQLLEENVRLQLRSDVPLGTYLSGGLDSSIVTTIASQHVSGLKCFTGRFTESSDYDESRYARAVTLACGASLHVVTPSEQDFVDWMPHIVYALDEPAAGPGAFPQFLVSRIASKHVKVCLGGQGGDELFGGYARYLVAYLEQALKGAICGVHSEGNFVVTLDSIVPNMTTLRQYIPMLQNFWKNGLFDEPDARYFAILNRAPTIDHMLTDDMRVSLNIPKLFDKFKAVFNNSGFTSSINKMLHFDQVTLLPALLHIEDRASMYSGLESRVPLLARDIQTLAVSTPPTIKFKGGRLKYLLAEAARSLVTPEILQRKDKMGFPVPLSEWMRRGPVREFVADVLLSSASMHRGIYTPQALRGLVTDACAGSNRHVWGALCLELWFQTFLDGAPCAVAAPRMDCA